MAVHADIKLVKALGQKKNREERKMFLVEGEKMVAELLESHLEITSVYATEHWSGWGKFSGAVRISPADLQRMSQLKTANNVLAVARLPQASPNWAMLAKKQVLLLDRMNDPGNMGTIIRTAEWFGMGAVIASPQSVELFNPKTVQASMGSIFRVPVFQESLKRTIERLKQLNPAFNVMAADMEGEDAYSFQWPKEGALVTGSESHGIDKNLWPLVDHRVHIRGFGMAESLNASIATAICCYSWRNTISPRN